MSYTESLEQVLQDLQKHKSDAIKSQEVAAAIAQSVDAQIKKTKIDMQLAKENELKEKIAIIGKDLLDAISSKNAENTLKQLLLFKENMRNPDLGANYVGWITDPTNITNVHKLLMENLDLPPKLLSIRRIAVNRTQRAVMLTLAMESALKRVHGL